MRTQKQFYALVAQFKIKESPSQKITAKFCCLVGSAVLLGLPGGLGADECWAE